MENLKHYAKSRKNLKRLVLENVHLYLVSLFTFLFYMYKFDKDSYTARFSRLSGCSSMYISIQNPVSYSVDLMSCQRWFDID